MLTRLATAKSLGELADLSRFLFEAKARLLQATPNPYLLPPNLSLSCCRSRRTLKKP